MVHIYWPWVPQGQKCLALGHPRPERSLVLGTQGQNPFGPVALGPERDWSITGHARPMAPGCTGGECAAPDAFVTSALRSRGPGPGWGRFRERPNAER
jgi:hypothetical protein